MRFALPHVSTRATAVTVAGLIAALATAGPASASAAAPAAGCTWNITRAAAPEGLTWLTIAGASQEYFVGHGSTEDYSATKAILWSDHGAKETTLDSPGQGDAVATDVNRKGVVVANDLVENAPYLWSKGTLTRLAKPAGASSVRANAINDAGTVVGSASIDGETHGIVWSVSSPGNYRDLGADRGVLDLVDIDNDGTIVAVSSSLDDSGANDQIALKGTVSGGFSPITEDPGITRTWVTKVSGPYILGGGAFLDGDDWNAAQAIWNAGTYIRLPDTQGVAAINRSGLAVGGQTVDVGDSTVIGQPMVWKDGVSTLLPTLLPKTGGGPEAVTDDGLVAGIAWSSTDPNAPGLVPVTWTCS